MRQTALPIREILLEKARKVQHGRLKKKKSTMKEETVQLVEGQEGWPGRLGPSLLLLLHPGPEQRLQGQHCLTDTNLFTPTGALRVPHRRAAEPKAFYI